MKDDEREFSWYMLFIVTSCSSFLFNGIIKVMDGSFSDLLLMVSVVAAFLAVINWSVRTLARQASRKRRKRRLAS